MGLGRSSVKEPRSAASRHDYAVHADTSTASAGRHVDAAHVTLLPTVSTTVILAGTVLGHRAAKGQAPVLEQGAHQGISDGFDCAPV